MKTSDGSKYLGRTCLTLRMAYHNARLLARVDRSLSLIHIFPVFKLLIRKIYLLLPLVMLVIWVSGNYMTMQKAASYAIVLSVIVSLFDKENRLSLIHI